MLRSLIAIAIVFGALAIYPGPGVIYDLLAAPLTAALPEGTKMVAIGVITPFMVPLKVTGMLAFVLALPFAFSGFSAGRPRDRSAPRFPDGE